MGSKVQDLGIDRLPIEERLALVEEIWSTICAEPGAFVLTDAQRRELEQRRAEDDRGPEAAAAWDEVKRSFLQRLQG